jgi:hypothetical protein
MPCFKLSLFPCQHDIKVIHKEGIALTDCPGVAQREENQAHSARASGLLPPAASALQWENLPIGAYPTQPHKLDYDLEETLMMYIKSLEDLEEILFLPCCPTTTR